MTKQEVKTILPGIHNLAIPSIRLTNKQISYGKLRVGGSVLVFSSLSSQINIPVLLPLESIEKIAFKKIAIDPLLLIRRATVKYELEEKQQIFIMKCGGQKLKYYDPSIFKEFLSDPIEVLKELNGQLYENSIELISFNGEKFCFSSTCEYIRSIYDEIILFIVKFNQINQEMLILETSGTEDFEYYIFQRPKNIDKAVQQLVQTAQQPKLLFQRKSIKIHKKEKVQKVGKLTATEQINLLQKMNDRQLKRKTNTKKFDKKYLFQFETQYDYLDTYLKTGNLSGTKLPFDYQNLYSYEIVSEDDVEFPVRQFINKIDQINLSFDLLQAAANGHENSKDLVIQSLYNLLRATQGFQLEQSEYSTQINYFQDRVSRIFDQDELEIIFNQIPPEFSQMKIFIQYQCSQDGRYLHNIYNSFKQSEVGILSWVVDQHENHVQILPDHLAPNWMLVFRSKLQKFGCFFSEYKQNAVFSEKQLIVFSNENEYKFYHLNENSKIFAFLGPHSMTIGGKGAAIHIVKELNEVQSSYCDTFQSPPLFKGQLIGGYETIEIDEVEVWRFLL